jgi:hypothetical protein
MAKRITRQDDAKITKRIERALKKRGHIGPELCVSLAVTQANKFQSMTLIALDGSTTLSFASVSSITELAMGSLIMKFWESYEEKRNQTD